MPYTNTPLSAHRADWVRSLVTSVARASQHPWVESIVHLSAVDDSGQALHPLLPLPLAEVRCRVVEVVNESAQTKTFVLQPDALWEYAHTGQFVRVRQQIGGRRVERVYRLSSQPGAPRIAFTVKRQSGVQMSDHLHNHVKAGDVLTISQAMSEFGLPAVLPPKMLLLSADGGITQMMAMLRSVQAQGYRGDLVFMHICRTPRDLIFANALKDLAARWLALRLFFHSDQFAGHFTTDTLQNLVPDLSERSTWLCCPSCLMDAVHQLWADMGVAAPLKNERRTNVICGP